MIVLGLPLVARELGASALVIGGLLSASALILIVVQPIIGLGLDRYGRRPFLIVGLLAYAVSSVIFALASGITGLYLAMLAQGIGAGLFWLAVLTITSDLASDDSLGESFGGVEEMSIRGILVGTLVPFALFYLLNGEALGSESSWITIWRILFLGFTATSLLAAAIVWRGIPESLQKDTDRPQKDRPVKSDQKWSISRQLGIVFGIVALTASAGAIISPILIKYLNDNISTSLFAIALAFLPAALAGSVLPSRLGGLSDRIGRRPLLVGALLVGAVATLAVPFVRSLWPLALVWVLEAAAFAAAVPAEEALVVDLAGNQKLGMTMGLYTAAAGLGAVIGPLLGGWLYDHIGALSVFGTAALLLALGAGSILLFVREPSKS